VTSLAAARALLDAGQPGAAERLCEEALAHGESVELRFLLGSARYRQGRHAAALAALERALALDPSRHDVRFALASTLAVLDRKQDAAAQMQACLDAAPGSAELAVALAALREELREPEAAMALYDRALQADPSSFPARLNRGVLLLGLKRPDEALAEFETLAAQAPSPAVHVNRAQALFALYRDAEALAAAEAALAMDPRHVLGVVNRALALAALGRLAQSEEAFRGARQLDPAQFDRIVADPAYGSWKDTPPDPRSIAMLRGVQRLQLCDWRRRDETIALVRGIADHPLASLLAKRHIEIAFDALALPLTAAEQRRLEAHVARAFPEAPFPRPPRPVRERIRVAFLSPDFRPHPMAWLSRHILRGLDRARFEVVAYALNPDAGDPLRLSLLRETDRFIDASAWTDDEIAARIADDGIDVLVECGGYCEGARPAILARRPAPVQASYLGMPGTLGLACVDYRISDAFCTPASAQPHWAEKLVLLPETHLVYEPPAAVDAPTREALGLPGDAFVYCCLSNPLKIEPVAFGAWMRILRETPHGVLWIHAEKALVRENLRREARAAGVDPARLRFAGRVPHEAFVAAAGRADLFLDTLHFGAHTTAMDVLWGGLPILTLPGQTMASRLAGSLMHAARIPELVVPDLDAYVATAVRLANAPAELAVLRARLAAARSSAPIFDVQARVRAFGQGIEAMHRRRLAGLAPETIVVTTPAS